MKNILFFPSASLLLFLAASGFCTACGAPSPEGENESDCSDNVDNDKDGKIDCDDDGCLLKTACRIPSTAAAPDAEKEASGTRAGPKQVFAPPPPDNILNVENLQVQFNHNGADIKWKDAKEYCEGLVLEGRSDWRLPTKDELVKMYKSGKFPKDGYVFWSSDTSGSDRAWFVGMGSGAAHEFGKNHGTDSRARCVRNTQ